MNTIRKNARDFAIKYFIENFSSYDYEQQAIEEVAEDYVDEDTTDDEIEEHLRKSDYVIALILRNTTKKELDNIVRHMVFLVREHYEEINK